jgi:hypothetical protein
MPTGRPAPLRQAGNGPLVWSHNRSPDSRGREVAASSPLPSSGGRGARSYCLRIESTAPPDTRGGRAQRLVAAPAAVCLSLSLLPCAVPSPLFRAGLEEAPSEPASEETRTARRAARPPCLGRTWPGFRGDFTGRWRPPLQFGRAACPQMQIVVGTHQHL